MDPRATVHAQTPFEPCGHVFVVASVDRYRRYARELCGPHDAVLEIGCSSGEATVVMAKRAARVVAVDVSVDAVERTKERFAALAHVSVHRIDARNPAGVAELLADPTLVFLDIGGNALLDNVAFLVRQCLRLFAPRALVVRSAELAALSAMTEVVEPFERSPLRVVSHANRRRFAMQCLLDQSESCKVDIRVFAVYRFFALRTPACRDRLEQMLADDPHPRVKRLAAAGLAHWDDPPSSARPLQEESASADGA
jgi:precorrin-6B methylase 2